ncbi:MAG: MFS transporter [Promethearchaeia archaeon]
MTKGSYAVLLACVLAHFFNHLYTGVLSPFLPVIRDEFSLNLTEVGIITSASVITMTTSHLAVGYLGDKGWRHIFIPASVLLTAFTILLTSVSVGFLMLVFTQVLLGLAASGYHPSAFPALTETFPDDARARATGVQAMGGLIGMAIIPLLGVILLVYLGGWRESLGLLGIVGILIGLPVIYLMRYPKNNNIEEVTQENRKTGTKGWTKGFVLGVFYMALRGMAFRCTTLLMPLYLVETYGYESLWAGSLTTIMLTSGIFAELIAGPLSDITGKRAIFMIFSTGVSAVAIFALNLTLSPVMLIVVLVVLGFAYYFGVPPNTAFLTEASPEDTQGLAFGLLFSLGAIPGAISPIIFGIIGDLYGLPASILYLVITTTLATIIALFLRDLKKSSVKATGALESGLETT